MNRINTERRIMIVFASAFVVGVVLTIATMGVWL